MSFRLLKTYWKYALQVVKQMSDTTAPAIKEKVKYDGRIKKRNWEERRSDRNTPEEHKRLKFDGVRIKRRKYAMLMGYSGADYYGMQRNPKMKTIEEDLLNALLKADLITEEAFSQIQTIQFQRAARTDKGVSAARQVVSLKLPEQVDTSLVNKELPDQIKVFSIKRVTKGFNSKSSCDGRTYIYMLPTLSFSKFSTTVTPETYRIDEITLNQINDTLKMFHGTKNFHNFTSRKKFRDPSANRYIISFEIEKPFVRKDIEFAVIKVKGQSFMLHQIRKMIGLTIAVVRGHTTCDTVIQSYTADRLDLPMAPGLGLVLDQVHYDRYNARYGKDHDTLVWEECNEDVAAFKEEFIYPTIIDTEINEKSMITWLETLPKHSFSVRSDELCDESEDKDDEEKDSDIEDLVESGIKEKDIENSNNIKISTNVIDMSVLHRSKHGWIISHEEFIKNIYKNVLKDNEIYNLQLKKVLFNINCPYLRYNEKKNKDGKCNLKKKRKIITSNSNFEELKNEIDYVENTYKLLFKEFEKDTIFNSYLNNNDNKEAQQEAVNCYNEIEKYSFINSHGSNGDQALLRNVNGGSFLFPNTCKFFCKNITEMSDIFHNEQFDLILLDPPWWNKYIRRKRAKSNQGYQMMYNLDLGVIPIEKILAPEGLVVVWCTNSPQHLKDLQEEIFPKWGIRTVAKWYWLKVTCKGDPICSFSEPPGKQPFEQIVFGVRQNSLINSVPDGKLVVSIPSALHSHKPPLVDLLTSYVGSTPRCLEIFARYLLPGWTSWGLEVAKLQHECLYEIQH